MEVNQEPWGWSQFSNLLMSSYHRRKGFKDEAKYTAIMETAVVGSQSKNTDSNYLRGMLLLT